MCILFLATLALASPVHLYDLLAEAQAHNADVAAAAARAQAANYLLRASSALDDPMLSAQLWNVPMDFSTVPLMVELSQPLPLGGKRQARRAMAEAEKQLAEALQQQQRRELDGAVATAYFEMFTAEQTVAVNAHLAETLQALLDVAVHRASTGLSDQVEALRLQSELIVLEGENIRLRAERATANARLVALLDRPPGSEVGTPMRPHGPVDLPSQEILRQGAFERRPEAQALRAMVAKSRAEVQLAEAEGVPDIAPMIGYMRDFGGPGEHNFGILGVSGSLPLFRSDKIEPRIAAARAQNDALEHGARALHGKIAAEIATLCAQAEAEAQTIQIHHRLIPLSQQALSTAISSYTVGRGSFLLVLASVREVQMHQLDLARHLAAYETRLADLERATNTDLGLRGASEGAAPLHDGETP